MRKSDALFYPQTVCLDERVLKYLLLHFERIWFAPIDNHLNPGQTSISRRFSLRDALLASMFGSKNDVRYSNMYVSEPTVWDDNLRRLMAAYDALEEDGICCPLRDERFENPSTVHPLKAAVDSDLRDSEFQALCDRYTLPAPILPDDIGGEWKGGGVAMRPLNVYPLAQRSSAICSERINTTLYLADAHDLVPVSTHPVFMRLFGTKLKRVVTNPEFSHERGAELHGRALKRNLLSWDLFVEVIPDHVVVQRSVHDIVRYRQEFKHSYDLFREYLSSLEAEIAAAPWDETLSREVDRLVRGKILPAARNLHSERIALWERLYGNVGERTVASIALGLSLIPALSYWELLWYAMPGAGAALAALAPGIKETILEHRRLRRSALFFLVNLR